MSDQPSLPRRALLGATALGLLVSQFRAESAFAQASGSRTRLGSSLPQRLQPLKYIDASVLKVEYFELGPSDGAPVILLHGWPYDIHTYVDVAPLLAAAGHRVIVPHLRGYGGTRFLSDSTPRNGQQSALAATSWP